MKLRGILSNIAALLASEVMNKLTTFIVYALVARNLGAYAFGQLSLGLTLLYAFQMLASLGLRSLVTREISKDPTQTKRYVYNAMLAVLLGSLCAMLLMVGMTLVMQYNRDTTFAIMLLSLSLLPNALAVIFESALRAWEKMSLITLANMPAYVLRVGLVWMAISAGFGLSVVILILLATTALVAFIEWLQLRSFILPQLPRTPNDQIQPQFLRTLLRDVRAFVGIEFILAITASITYLIISKLLGEAELGLYNAATQLLSIATTIALTLVAAVFPKLCRDAVFGNQALQRSTERLMQLQMMVILPMTLALFFYAEAVFVFLQGATFAASAPVLRIMVWALVGLATNAVLGQVLVAGMREKQVVKIVILDAVVILLLTLVLVPTFGLNGAAIATLIGRAINFALHFVFAKQLLRNVSFLRFVWMPFVAAAGMAGFAAWLNQPYSWVGLVLACAVYGCVLAGLMVWSVGGPTQVRTRWRTLFSA